MRSSQVADEADHVDVLVNNAGYGLYGPVEQLPMDEIRRQFETNFFGLVRLTQLVLPRMRAARPDGSSTCRRWAGGHPAWRRVLPRVETRGGVPERRVAGRGAPVRHRRGLDRARPGQDRLERRRQPPSVRRPTRPTDDWATTPTWRSRTPWQAAFSAVTEGPMSRLSLDADGIAKVMVKAATTRRPRTRYLINPVAKSSVAAKACCPTDSTTPYCAGSTACPDGAAGPARATAPPAAILAGQCALTDAVDPNLGQVLVVTAGEAATRAGIGRVPDVVDVGQHDRLLDREPDEPDTVRVHRSARSRATEPQVRDDELARS